MSSFCNVYQEVLKNIPAKLNFLEYNEATNMKENILTLFDLKDTQYIMHPLGYVLSSLLGSRLWFRLFQIL